MQEYQVFSKRKNVIQYDVFEYENFSKKLRNQIYFILKDALAIDFASQHGGSTPASFFNYIHETVCQEHGLRNLTDNLYFNDAQQCENYLMNGQDTEILLDLIEFSMRQIKELRSEFSHDYLGLDEEEAVQKLNQRFRENGIGYEFINGVIIRKDSELLQEEVVKPALRLLQEEDFNGATIEYLKAYDHFRKGNFGDCILNAGKAFESTMKTIGSREEWGLTGKENASNLVNLLIKNNVIPSYLQTSLQGLATVRNELGGHGDGDKPKEVPEHLVNYALHLCGTNIVMLIEAYKAYKTTPF